MHKKNNLLALLKIPVQDISPPPFPNLYPNQFKCFLSKKKVQAEWGMRRKYVHNKYDIQDYYHVKKE